MGTDIYIVVEERTSQGWVAVNTLTEGFQISPTGALKDDTLYAAKRRNYRRFAALAGVRGDGPPAQGLPQDASDTVRLLWGRDAGHYHSASWLPMAEAARIFLETEAESIRAGLDDPAYVYFDVDAADIDRSRIVFWFDN